MKCGIELPTNTPFGKSVPAGNFHPCNYPVSRRCWDTLSEDSSNLSTACDPGIYWAYARMQTLPDLLRFVATPGEGYLGRVVCYAQGIPFLFCRHVSLVSCVSLLQLLLCFFHQWLLCHFLAWATSIAKFGATRKMKHGDRISAVARESKWPG